MIKILFLIRYLLLITLVGCSYKLGLPSNQLGSIHLTVRNDSLGAQLAPLVDIAVREEILNFSGSPIVSNRKDADTFLIVTLSGYGDTPETFRKDDTIIASSFGMHLSAEVVLKNRAGEKLYKTTVIGKSSVLRTTIDTVPNDRVAKNALAKDIASKVVLSLLNESF